ncbi:MAG: protein kinase [Polyangiaceae bacterium]
MSAYDVPYDGPPGVHSPGDVLASKYRLEQLAGEGAMGEVWLATHLALKMPVALKLIRHSGRSRRDGLPTLARGGETQLLREAQAIARFTHPNIVRVHDFGLSDAGEPFIVMERLEGEDLRDRLQRVMRIPAVEAVGLALLVIHAMHTAHARGVVHRDLKPENIFLTTDDEGRVVPKIVDFGIADLEWETNSKPALAGTPVYMAPEQLALGATDHRVDVWAISVVLYEMVSGRTPAAARAASNVVTTPGGGAVQTELPCLGPEHGVDEELWSVIAGGLQPVANRFASMRELGEALAKWLLARGVTEGMDGVSLSAKWFEEPRASRRPPEAGADSIRGWERRVPLSYAPKELPSRSTGRVITHVRSLTRGRWLIGGAVVAVTLVGCAGALGVGGAFTQERGATARALGVDARPARASAARVEPQTVASSAAGATRAVAERPTTAPPRPANRAVPVVNAPVDPGRAAAPPPRKPYSLPVVSVAVAPSAHASDRPSEPTPPAASSEPVYPDTLHTTETPAPAPHPDYRGF